jgi:pilus assembly protein CpaB
MKPVRIIVLAVAAVAAITLAVVVRSMLSGKPTTQAVAAVPIAKPKPMAKVLVAKRDLKVGERLTGEDIDWQDWPVEAVNPAFVTDGSTPAVAAPAPVAVPAKTEDKAGETKARAKPTTTTKIGHLNGAVESRDAVTTVTRTVAMLGDGGPKAQFLGAVVREPFLKGEPIVARKVVRAGDSGYLAVVLPAGMRAMAVPVKVETAAGGFILPGDRVDVILSRQIQPENGGRNNMFVTNTVLRNIKVLAVDQVAQADKDETTVVGATATLEVTPTDAEVLALAKATGDISLTLRSYADVAGPSGHTGPLPRVAQIAQQQQSRGVRVFRNGVASEVNVRP